MAVKSIKKDQVKDSVEMRHIRGEMEIMSSIHHKHIIQIYEGKTNFKFTASALYAIYEIHAMYHQQTGALARCSNAALSTG